MRGYLSFVELRCILFPRRETERLLNKKNIPKPSDSKCKELVIFTVSGRIEDLFSSNSGILDAFYHW